MSERALAEKIETLDEIARANIDWKPLKDNVPELRERIEWLRRQSEQIPAPLVAVLFGGTGTGKSTLLNAIAGAPIADAGPSRPTTEKPTVYHPLGPAPEIGSANYIGSGHLHDLVLVDLPDTDSVKLENRERVRELLEHADVVLFCGTQQKYKNEQSLTLLRPYQNERKVICIQTRADEDADICADWLEWLRGEGFEIERCYRVSAHRAFARKFTGGPAGDEFEYGELEDYLRDRLPPERAEIKTQNVYGAVRNTTQRLLRAFHAKEEELVALDGKLAAVESSITQTTMQDLQARLMNEPHVWMVALGDAVSERAFGLIGLLYRILHGLRMLPSRITGRFSLAGLLQSVAPAKDAGKSGSNMPGDLFLRQLAAKFKKEHSEAAAYLSRSGFPVPDFLKWQQTFLDELKVRLAEYLEPAQRRLNTRARRLSSWFLPVLELIWLVPLLFTLWVPVCAYYWNLVRHANVVLPEPDFLMRSAGMIAVIIFFELAVFTWTVRIAGRGLRNKMKKELARIAKTEAIGFAPEREIVQRAHELTQEMKRAAEQ